MDFLAQPLAPVLAGFYAIVASYGLAIILVTLVVRVLLLPLSIKSTRSMREMQVIQPELKKLQKKYKGDRQKLNEETMKLYKEHGVNPLGGCLPLLLQMPVFFALFYLIRDPLNYLAENVALASDLNQHPLEVHNFLGMRLDCSPVDVYQGADSAVAQIGEACTAGGILPAIPYFMMLVVMAASTFYQQRQMMATRGPVTDPQQQQMQRMMKFLPIMLAAFGITFPAGVLLYWLTTNVWTIVQQRIMLKAAPPTPAKGASKGSADDKAGKGDKTPAKAGAKSDGKGTAKKAQLKGGPGQPARKSPDRKAPSGSSPSGKSGKGKKKR